MGAQLSGSESMGFACSPIDRRRVEVAAFAERGFERGAVPEAEIGGGAVGAFEKRQQRRFRVGLIAARRHTATGIRRASRSKYAPSGPGGASAKPFGAG